MYGEHSMPPLRRPRHAPGPPVGVRLLRRFWQHFFPPAVGEGEAGAGPRPFCADYGHCDRGAEPEAAEAPRFSRAELEDMIRRWDLEQNEWACRDLLIAAFPQATGRWSAEELAEMDTMDLLVETGRQDPETALRMVELLLSTAEGHLQEPEAANQLLGWDMSDLLVSEEMLPLLVRELRKNGRLARQLFQSAYVGRPQEELLNACGRMGEWELQQRLLELLARNPFPHDAPELEPEESLPGRSPYHGPQPEG